MRSFHLYALLLLITGCGAEQVATQTYTQQEGIVKISVATRGSYQFILQPDSNDSTKNYLITNYADTLRSYFFAYNSNIRKLPVLFSGVALPEKGTVYYPGPNDGPVPAYDLPTVRLTTLSRR